MVIDTSAILAILQREPERQPFLEAIEAAGSNRMFVESFVESSIVIELRLPHLLRQTVKTLMRKL